MNNTKIEIISYVLMVGVVLSSMYLMKDHLKAGTNQNICIVSKYYPSFGCSLAITK